MAGRTSRFGEDIEEESRTEKPRADKPKESNGPEGFNPPGQNVMWRYVFLLVIVAYTVATIYVAALQVGSVFTDDGTAESTSSKTARSLLRRAETTSQETIDVDGVVSQATQSDWMLKLFGCIALAVGTSTTAFLIAVFRPRWLFHLSASVLTLSGGAALAVALWNSFYLKDAVPGSSAAVTPYCIALAAGLGLWVLWHKRLENTYTMLESVRLLTRHQYRFYGAVLGGTAIQALLAVWTIFSIIFVLIRYMPGAACKDSPCGVGIVVGLILLYAIAQTWMSATLSEIVNAALAGSYYSRTLYPKAVDTRFWTHLSVQVWASLGTHARNAILCDSVEYACWQYTNLDRVPFFGKALACFFSKKIAAVSKFLESYNRYIGIVAATHAYEYDYVETKEAAYPFIKRGHGTATVHGEEMSVAAEDRGLGRHMGPIQTKLRTERVGYERLKPEHWVTGLGAFLESHQTKSVLVLAAIACACLTSSFIYVLTFWPSGDPTPPSTIDTLLYTWSIAFAFFLARQLMCSVEAGVNCLQVWLYDPWNGRDPRVHAHTELEKYLHERLDVGPNGTWGRIQKEQPKVRY